VTPLNLAEEGRKDDPLNIAEEGREVDPLNLAEEGREGGPLNPAEEERESAPLIIHLQSSWKILAEKRGEGDRLDALDLAPGEISALLQLVVPEPVHGNYFLQSLDDR
jgi:hypothetical protein